MGTDVIDSMDESLTIGNNFYITLEPESAEEAEKVFHALSEGGSIQIPLKKEFWAEKYGCAMLEPGAKPCSGCSMVMDNIGHNLSHVNARDTTFVFTSPAPQEEIIALQKRMNWNAPWYTDHGRRFADAFGAGRGFAVNVFIRNENHVYRTYYTTARGEELFDTHFRLLDLTPFGRQETWEDSPESRPQTPPYQWWRLHDEYEN